MKKRFVSLVVSLSGLLLLGGGDAFAISYTLNYMDSWSGCDAGCNQASSLSYTDDQINYLDSVLSGLGHTKKRKYSNLNVWAGDLIEDKDFNGADYYLSDDSDLYAFSGHGRGLSDDSAAENNAYGQTASFPYCKAGSSTSCTLDVERSRMGERTSAYATPHQGSMRYMLFFTCFSVDTKPIEQWAQTFWYGTDYVMGYRGLSVDSSYTDEVGGDWADEVFDESETLKAAWFWAIEDWWIDDVGALISGGTTSSAAINRRDNMTKTWARRPNSDVHIYFSSAHHQG